MMAHVTSQDVPSRPGPAVTPAELERSRAPLTEQRRRQEPTYSAVVPLAIVVLTLLVWVGFQTLQLYNERQRLQAGVLGQEQLVQNSQKLRTSLDSLASETAKLAEDGNPNARLLVDELRKRGITINPSAQPGK